MYGKTFEVYAPSMWYDWFHTSLERVPKIYKQYAYKFVHKLPTNKKISILYGVVENKKDLQKWYSQLKAGLEVYRPKFPVSYPDFVEYNNGRISKFVEVKHNKFFMNVEQLVFHLYLSRKTGIDYVIMNDFGVYLPYGKLIKVEPESYDSSVLPTIKFVFGGEAYYK